ncbi:methyl-accepting chemotaxis protein [Lachnospiraceae bacterium OttesenSCG-928-D06]|nr:methyl-accepting chemotaxis protein [Lachnospiraceae bacterium OttesenSCG-928-D06]
MKKISTIICIAIFLCVLASTLSMATLSVNLSSREIREEAEFHLEALSNQYANAMNVNLTKYETIINSLSDYITTTYDIHKLKDGEYSAEYLTYMDQFVYESSTADSNILGIYFYLNPTAAKAGYGVWYSEGEPIIEDPVEQYAAYLNQEPGWEFYYDAVECGESVWLTPYYDPDIDKNCTSYSTPIYIDDILCGVIGLDIEMAALEDMVAEVHVYDTGRAFLVDADGYFIADAVYTSQDSLVSVGYNALADALHSSKKGIIHDESLAESHYFAYSLLDNGFSFVTVVKSDEVVSGINEVKDYAVTAGLIICGIAVVLSFILGKSISGPIVKTTLDMGLMEEGNFTGQKHSKYVKRRNEIGILARAMNAIQTYMSQTIDTIRRNSNNVHHSSKEIHHITKQLLDQVANISAASEELAAGTEETAAMAENLSAVADQITGYVEEMETRSNTCYADVVLIEKRALTLQEESIASSKAAEELSHATGTRLRNAIEDSKQVSKIQELSEAILEIAEQTSLLSLNASIESAHAGEAGKGFAIVSKEIGRLSDHSQKSAKEIQEISNQIMNTVNVLGEASSEMLQFMEGNMKETYSKLFETSQQYNADAKSILSTLSILTENISGISREIKVIASVIYDLTVASTEGAHGTTEIAASTEDIFSNIQSLQNNVGSLENISTQLVSIVKKFVTE